MRFIMLMIPKGYDAAVPGAVPDAAAVAAMMKYNESLQKAGILLGTGWPPSAIHGGPRLVLGRQAEGYRRAFC